MSKEQQEFEDTLDYAMSAPILEHPMSKFPEPMVQQATLYRLLHADECMTEEMATEFEVLGYLSSASLVRPLTTNLTDVMHHLFNKHYPKQAFGGDDPRVANLNADAQRELIAIRKWMFRKQMKHLRNFRKAQVKLAQGKLARAQQHLEDFA